MHYCSRTVVGQIEPIHPNLAASVTKHLTHPFQRPIQAYNQRAYEWLVNQWQSLGEPPIVLDSGCGIGESSANLSKQFPDHLVIGVDQSLHRLTKHGANNGFYNKDNYLLLRADLVDIWRLMAQHQLKPAFHFILYPNPWPKKKHLQRRWHGHPVFADLLKLGGKLELRSNWQTYVQEFAFALQHCGMTTVNSETFTPTAFITPFEKKYALSGQTLYRLTATLS